MLLLALENLPSEIQYHWAEIRNRYDQSKGWFIMIGDNKKRN